MLQWEYTCVVIGAKDFHQKIQTLNNFGTHRWELIFIEQDVFYFKRPKQ
ncbi:MAG TPA: hypothetical protein VF644_18250 [Pyrinomonadaceae bacterium]|jgi:hypothetical protein